MKSILEFLNSHASARKFDGREISLDDEQTIVTTAQRSPTSSNLQAYSIVGLRDKENKIALAEWCGGQEHIAESSLFLVFCADMAKLNKLGSQRGYNFNGDTAESFVLSTVDATLAASRALMAAQALGLAGVMVGGIRNHPDHVCQLLRLPEFVYPVMGMSVGYPVGAARLKPRLPIEAVYFRESYDETVFGDAVERYDRTIAEIGYLGGRETEPECYPNFEGTYSWSEHSARRMATLSTTTSRIHMLNFLKERGFLKR